MALSYEPEGGVERSPRERKDAGKKTEKGERECEGERTAKKPSLLISPLADYVMADPTANDAEIAAALAAVEEADAAVLARASGATNGAVVVAGGQGKDDDDASSSRAATAEQTADDGPPPAYERPTDEQIVAQENEIRAAVAGSAALIGEREPLSALRDEYRSDNASVFAAKAEALSKRYRALRRARGDGNCFFRSFMFALAEGLLERRDLAERNR